MKILLEILKCGEHGKHANAKKVAEQAGQETVWAICQGTRPGHDPTIGIGT